MRRSGLENGLSSMVEAIFSYIYNLQIHISIRVMEGGRCTRPLPNPLPSLGEGARDYASPKPERRGWGMRGQCNISNFLLEIYIVKLFTSVSISLAKSCKKAAASAP
jgi:hypothetical protein